MTAHRFPLQANLPDVISDTLKNADGNYPSLVATAERMCMSARTLKRRLQAHGVRFRELLDAARYRRASQLLEHSTLTVEQVAAEVGYSCPANFSRAFRRWSGVPPGVFRGSVTTKSERPPAVAETSPRYSDVAPATMA